MRKFVCFLFVLSTCQLNAQTSSTWTEDLIITPEKSNFEKTSTHADVMNFLQAIQAKSPFIKLSSIGKSTMGKEIPLVILSNPAVSTPAEAKALGKPVIYIQGNIHAGEVEGKEVAMMLMREILLGNKSYTLLDKY